MTSTMRKETMV